MAYFAEYSAKLSPHLEFDPRAFVEDKNIPQELCSFMLALALTYNDYKYYTITYDMLLKSAPLGKVQRKSVWGEHGGIKLHIIRLHVGFVHELFKLIQDNKRVLLHPFFKEVTRMLNKKGRNSWEILVQVALNEELTSKKSSPLHMVRNKVSFHYDTKELFVGYKRGFFRNGKSLENACISLGRTLENARFYFADKAIQGYLEQGLNVNLDEFFKSLGQIMKVINIALYNICTSFIQRRNFAWIEPNRS